MFQTAVFRLSGYYRIPARFLSLTVLPGIPPDERAFDALGPLKGIPVAAFVGAKDSEWMRGSQDTKEKLDALGIANTLEVVPGAALVVPLDPAKLFDRLDQRRPKNAGFYRADSKSQPYILVSHQAGSSRAEYAPIAPRLVKLDFNCLAIDQRSVGSCFGMGEIVRKQWQSVVWAAVIRRLWSSFSFSTPSIPRRSRACRPFLRTSFGLRLKMFPTARFSPWGAIGGGYALYQQGSLLSNGQARHESFPQPWRV